MTDSQSFFDDVQAAMQNTARNKVKARLEKTRSLAFAAGYLAALVAQLHPDHVENAYLQKFASGRSAYLHGHAKDVWQKWIEEPKQETP